MTEVYKAEKQGYAAYLADADKKDNPYGDDKPELKLAWLDGYYQAGEDAERWDDEGPQVWDY